MANNNWIIYVGIILLVIFLAGKFQPVFTIIPPEDTVASWNFDGTTLDSVGINHGVNYGAEYVDGKIGQALSFDGVGDYVLVEDDPSLDLVNDFTIAAWIYTKTIDDTTHRILHKNSAYTFGITSSNSRLAVYHYGEFASVYSNNNVLSPNTWHHVAVTLDSTTGVTFYVDGQSKGGNAALTANVPVNTNDVYIGIDEDLISYPFDGMIDELAIYNKALSEEEVYSLYAPGLPPGACTCNPSSVCQEDGSDCDYRGARSFTLTSGGTDKYWLDMPDNFDSSKTYPLVFYLHGWGGDYTQYDEYSYFNTLQPLFQGNDWIVVGVNDVSNSYNNATMRREIVDIFNDMNNNFNIDNSRVHVFGKSMGGGGTLQVLMHLPNIFASGVDLYGMANFTYHYDTHAEDAAKVDIGEALGGSSTEVPEIYESESAVHNIPKFESKPVWIFHSEDDLQVNIIPSDVLNQSLYDAGYTYKYTRKLTDGHTGAVIYGYEQDILDFFISHTLPSLTPPTQTSGGVSRVPSQPITQTQPPLEEGGVKEESFLFRDVEVFGKPIKLLYLLIIIGIIIWYISYGKGVKK